MSSMQKFPLVTAAALLLGGCEKQDSKLTQAEEHPKEKIGTVDSGKLNANSSLNFSAVNFTRGPDYTNFNPVNVYIDLSKLGQLTEFANSENRRDHIGSLIAHLKKHPELVERVVTALTMPVEGATYRQYERARELTQILGKEVPEFKKVFDAAVTSSVVNTKFENTLDNAIANGKDLPAADHVMKMLTASGSTHEGFSGRVDALGKKFEIKGEYNGYLLGARTSALIEYRRTFGSISDFGNFKEIRNFQRHADLSSYLDSSPQMLQRLASTLLEPTSNASHSRDVGLEFLENLVAIEKIRAQMDARPAKIIIGEQHLSQLLAYVEDAANLDLKNGSEKGEKSDTIKICHAGLALAILCESNTSSPEINAAAAKFHALTGTPAYDGLAQSDLFSFDVLSSANHSAANYIANFINTKTPRNPLHWKGLIEP